MDNELFRQIEKPVKLADIVALGSYEEVEGLDLESITKAKSDRGTKLDGLILKGYETRFADGTNTNGERYTKECLDDFFARYYEKRGLNMPLTVQHGQEMRDLIGRVLTVEVNSVGFYFVCYIPRALPEYDAIKARIKEGILQGLSKEGWATKCKAVYTKDGGLDYLLVEEMEMTAVSLVSTPANGNALENAQEVKNLTKLVKTQENKTASVDAFADMFN